MKTKLLTRIKKGIFSHSCHKGIIPAILVSGNFFTLGEDIFFFKATLFALFFFFPLFEAIEMSSGYFAIISRD